MTSVACLHHTEDLKLVSFYYLGADGWAWMSLALMFLWSERETGVKLQNTKDKRNWYQKLRNIGSCLVCTPHLVIRMQKGQCRLQRGSKLDVTRNQTKKEQKFDVSSLLPVNMHSEFRISQSIQKNKNNYVAFKLNWRDSFSFWFITLLSL